MDTLGYLRKRFGESGLELRNGIWTPKQIAMNEMQSQNTKNPERLTVFTRDGIYTRSYSERDWGNIYHELWIPYQYEKRFLLDVTDLGDIQRGVTVRNGRLYKYYYPDFVLIMADGSFFIHEHLGLIDKKEYRDAVGERICAFQANNIVPPDRFLITTPDDVRDPRRFRQLLINKVCPLV